MNIRGAVEDLGETSAELAIQKANDLAHSLQRESLAAELADYRDLRESVHRVEAAVAFSLWSNDASLIPPLQLAGGDAGQCDHVPGCEAALQLIARLFE